jgi:3-demethoxyubiquinol 3-hydroxylase
VVPQASADAAATRNHVRAARTPQLRDLRVAVIEPRAPTLLRACAGQEIPDARVFTITPSSRASLVAAGAWDAIERTRAPSFTSMHVWDALSPAHVRFEAASVGLEQLGWVVENRVLEAALWEELESLAGSSAGRLRVICPAAVTGLRLPTSAPREPRGATSATDSRGGDARPAARHHDSGLAELRLADGRILRAHLVVAADGAQSKVRELAHIGA